jgi:RNA polymerase sigma factor
LKDGGGIDLQFFSSSEREKFIEDNKGFIYRITCKICKRHLTWENDDELSIAMIAFNKACDKYSDEKGNIYSYSKTLIKNSLIDYFRKSKNTPILSFDNEETEYEYIDIKNSLNQFEISRENSIRSEEIKLLSNELKNYGLCFNDIVKSSPSHTDTRNTLLNIAFRCSQEELIVNHIKEKKQLPIKEIMLLTGTSRKILEKWRRYIILLLIVLSNNDYQYIKSYLNIGVGEKSE